MSILFSFLVLSNAVQIGFFAESGYESPPPVGFYLYRVESVSVLGTNRDELWPAPVTYEPVTNGWVTFTLPRVDAMRFYRVKRLEFGEP